jgi:hypothetical protein
MLEEGSRRKMRTRKQSQSGNSRRGFAKIWATPGQLEAAKAPCGWRSAPQVHAYSHSNRPWSRGNLDFVCLRIGSCPAIPCGPCARDTSHRRNMPPPKKLPPAPKQRRYYRERQTTAAMRVPVSCLSHTTKELSGTRDRNSFAHPWAVRARIERAAWSVAVRFGDVDSRASEGESPGRKPRATANGARQRTTGEGIAVLAQQEGHFNSKYR